MIGGVGSAQDILLPSSRVVIDLEEGLFVSDRLDDAQQSIADVSSTMTARDKVYVSAPLHRGAVVTTTLGATYFYEGEARWYLDEFIVTDATVQRVDETRLVDAYVEWDVFATGGSTLRANKVAIDADAPVVFRVGRYSYPINRIGAIGRGLELEAARVRIESSTPIRFRGATIYAQATRRYRRL